VLALHDEITKLMSVHMEKKRAFACLGACVHLKQTGSAVQRHSHNEVVFLPLCHNAAADFDAARTAVAEAALLGERRSEENSKMCFRVFHF
jgi:hypothetical protein